MPKRLCCTQTGKLAFIDYDDPALEPGQVRIQNEFGAAKHGTEMSFYKGYAAPRGRFDDKLKIFDGNAAAPPHCAHPLGNMHVGRVVEVASKPADLAIGDRVVAYGPFQPTLTVATHRAWKLKKNTSWKTAVCLDPADFAMAAVRDGHVRVGDAVVVFGLGAIGLMAIQFARLSGATPLIAVDPLANRRSVAKTLKADLVIDPSTSDAGRQVKQATSGRGADVAIDYSGNRRALQDALRAVAFGGRVVCGAYPPPYDAGLDFGAEAHMNRPNIIFSRANSDPNREYPRWNNDRIYETCVKLILEGKLNGNDIIQPVVPFANLIDEYPKIANDPGSNIKLGVQY